jgi:hypothetical protein
MKNDELAKATGSFILERFLKFRTELLANLPMANSWHVRKEGIEEAVVPPRIG